MDGQGGNGVMENRTSGEVRAQEVERVEDGKKSCLYCAGK